MYKINEKKGSIYANLNGTTVAHKKTGFHSNGKMEVSVGYDIRTNKSKLAKIKMREIKR